MTPRPTFPVHAGAVLDGVGGQTNWLGELLLHGHDIARAIEAQWELPERDMLLVVRGLLKYAPAFVRAPADTDIRVVCKIPEARPYLLRIHGGTAELRESRPDDRPDAVLRVSASTFAQLILKRVGPFTAARQGLRIVGGRRPWRALKLQSYFTIRDAVAVPRLAGQARLERLGRFGGATARLKRI